METDDIEIKRTVDSAGARIRVMTIHGAKGLEAPIVILPDTHKKTSQSNKDSFVMAEGSAHWRGSDATRASFQQAARLDPGLVPAHYNLGLALRQQGQLQPAADAFYRAIQVDPNFALGYANLGAALLEGKNLQQARDFGRTAN